MKSKWYRALHPTKEGHRLYRFASTQRVRHKLRGNLRHHPNCKFLDETGKKWAEIKDGWIVIEAGYAWNGCSPKRYIGWHPFGKWIGTPDFEKTLLASFIHDALFQFAKVGRYTFHEANFEFYQIMVDSRFRLADQYYAAVENWGGEFWQKDIEKVTAEYT